MKVILTEGINKLGKLGDTVMVKAGYARNFLIPTGRALYATRENLEVFEAKRAELERAQKDKVARAEALAEQLKALSIKIQSKAGEGGKLYGSVGAREIVAAVAADGIESGRQQVRLPLGAIREVGEYQVDIHLFSGIDVTLNIEVSSES